MAEEDLNIEPREPLELRMCMSEEWRDRLAVERISGHIAYCHNMQCGDQICRYFRWFPRHYSQCTNSNCQSCLKYQKWMTCHSKSCTYKSGCLLIYCSQLKTQQLRHQFRLLSQDAQEALTPTQRQDSGPISVAPNTHHHNTAPMINRQDAMQDDTQHSAILHRQNQVDQLPIGGEQGVTAFARNNSLTNSSQQPKCRSQDSGTSSQGSFSVDPESSIGFFKEHPQIVTSHTTDEEDNKMEGFHLQQRREASGNVETPDFLRLPRKHQSETSDNTSDDLRRLTQNSTDSDFYGSSHGSSPDSLESTEQTTLEERLSLGGDGSSLQRDEETSMEDSGSTQASGTTLVPSETPTSLSSNSSSQHFQPSLSSPSDNTAMSPATPFLEPALSSEEKKEVLERIDMCREENQGRIKMVENVGKFVHQQQMSDLVPKKTQEQLEAPCEFFPRGFVPDFDIDYIQDSQLAESKLFGKQEHHYYQQMMAQPLPEEEEVIEETLNHRNCVKEYLQGQFYQHRVYREGYHWERLWKLGCGGQATCYGTADRHSNSLLALKEGKEDLKSLDEAYICLKLACLIKNAPPNIIEYFGAAMLPSRPSTIQLFLELMPTCLQEYLFKCGPLALEKVHHYAYQLFDAVDFLHHKLKIVHCDIKPANLLIDQNTQRLKVADFGCAELLEECHLGPSFRGNEKAGTLAYNPPEHYREKRCSFAFDIWQAGGAVLAMSTGKRPWRHLFMDCIDQRKQQVAQRKKEYRHMIGQQFNGHMIPAFLGEGLQQVLFGCLHSDYSLRLSAQDCMYLLATSEACTPEEKAKVQEALGYCRNPKILQSFQPNPNRLDVYLGVPHCTATVDGLDHALQGGWLGWIPYHERMSYGDAQVLIAEKFPVARYFFPFSLGVCENMPQAIWRTLNGHDGGTQFLPVAQNTPVDRTKAIVVKLVCGSRSERLPQSPINLKSTASQDTDEDPLYVDSEEEVELSDELEEPASNPLSPLFSALVNDHYLEFKSLLEKGGNPNEVEPATKASLLHWVAEKGSTDAVKLLIKFKANIDAKDDCGTTPLMRACKKRHIDVVKILLDSGAKVNEEAANGRIPLHEASVVGDGEIVKLLIQKEADVLSRDDSGFTPYQLAFRKGYKDVMEILLQYIPTVAHPYNLLGSTSLSSSQTITTLVFLDGKLISGSKDCNVSVYNSVDLTLSESIPLSNTVLAVDVWDHYLAVGSTTVQILDSKKESHTLDRNSDTLHFVAFGFDGHLATASIEGNEAKLWIPVWLEEKDEMRWKYDSTITVGTTPTCISSLSVSQNSSQPWLAIGVQLGSKFKPAGNKLVCLFDWSTRRPLHEFETGHGGLAVDVYTDFSPDGREVAIGCGDELGVWETETGAQVKDFSSRITAPDTQVDVHVSSLCFSPDGTHLAAGLSTGEVQVFERCSGNSLFNIISPESSTPATSIAYSPNGKLLAAGYQNGILQLWKAYAERSSNCHQAALNQSSQDQKPHFLDQVKLHKKPLLARIQQLEFNSDGGTYHSPEDGYSLTVPKGAIPENMGSVSIQCGVIPYGPLGPFKYPDGVMPVSPIVWFCSTPSVEFQKPVEIVIPHCLDCKGEEDTQSLAFFKANHDDYIVSDSGQKMFDFKKAEGTASFPLSTSNGTLHSKHFCFFCVGVYSREVTAHANFCLITAKPACIEARCRIHFCLIYFLPTCIKAVEEQFGADYDLSVKMRMKFQVTTRGADPSIKIKFERNLPGCWSIKRESMRKEICASEVYFWDNLPHELELMHEQKMYPPRFTLQVCGEKATHDATAVVEFEGACEDLSTEIHLSLPTTVPESSVYKNGQSLIPIPDPTSGLPPAQCFPKMAGQMLPTSLCHVPPSDVDIEEVTKEVMGKLRDDWEILQSYLGIPDDFMFQVTHERSERNKIRTMLKTWRCTSSGSRAQLAECLRKADPRLHQAVKLLMSPSDRVGCNGHLDNWQTNGVDMSINHF